MSDGSITLDQLTLALIERQTPNRTIYFNACNDVTGEHSKVAFAQHARCMLPGDLGGTWRHYFVRAAHHTNLNASGLLDANAERCCYECEEPLEEPCPVSTN